MPDISLNIREDIFRIDALEMPWDIGMVVYQPADATRISAGPTAIVSASSCFTAAYRIINPSKASRESWRRSSASKSPA